MIALWVNGSKRHSPSIRFVTAAADAAVWGWVTALLWHDGYPGVNTGAAPTVRFSKAECDAMLVKALGEFADGSVERCIKGPIKDEPYVAFLDLAYNIGSGAFCKSTVVKRWNAGVVGQFEI